MEDVRAYVQASVALKKGDVELKRDKADAMAAFKQARTEACRIVEDADSDSVVVEGCGDGGAWYVRRVITKGSRRLKEDELVDAVARVDVEGVSPEEARNLLKEAIEAASATERESVRIHPAPQSAGKRRVACEATTDGGARAAIDAYRAACARKSETQAALKEAQASAVATLKETAPRVLAHMEAQDFSEQRVSHGEGRFMLKRKVSRRQTRAKADLTQLIEEAWGVVMGVQGTNARLGELARALHQRLVVQTQTSTVGLDIDRSKASK